MVKCSNPSLRESISTVLIHYAGSVKCFLIIYIHMTRKPRQSNRRKYGPNVRRHGGMHGAGMWGLRPSKNHSDSGDIALFKGRLSGLGKKLHSLRLKLSKKYRSKWAQREGRRNERLYTAARASQNHKDLNSDVAKLALTNKTLYEENDKLKQHLKAEELLTNLYHREYEIEKARKIQTEADGEKDWRSQEKEIRRLTTLLKTNNIIH